MHVQWLVVGLSVRPTFLVGKLKSDVKEVGRFKVRVNGYAEFIRLK